MWDETRVQRKQVDMMMWIEDYIEEYNEVPEAIDVAEQFHLKLDDLDEVEHLVNKYDAEGTFWIGDRP